MLGIKGFTKEAKIVLDCWKLFFSNEIIHYITDCTNQNLQKIRLTEHVKNYVPTDFEEMSAFVGLLYLAGVKKVQHLNTLELWNTKGRVREYFAATI